MDKDGAYILALTSPASRGGGSNPRALQHDGLTLPEIVFDHGVHCLANRFGAFDVTFAELLCCELKPLLIGRVKVMRLRVRSGARDSL